MECWTEARALKPSRRGEATAVKLGKPVGSEELLCLNHVSSGDDFSVECFLDFSGDDDDGVEDALIHGGEEEDEDQEGQEIVSVSSSQEQAEDDNGFGFGFGPPCSDSTPADQLPLPVDDIAELEWVSRFVDDCSLPELSLLFPARKAKPGNQTYPQSEPEAYRSALRTKPRSKRARNGKTCWPSVSLTAGAALPSAADVVSGGNQSVGKKQRKKGGESREAITFQRRCSHCGAHNTPQWRTGPLGAKTLCNACGVRYKSGRLCPEYRPAGSPTFSSEIHSNNHRRVLELRKRTQLGQSGPIDLAKGRE